MSQCPHNEELVNLLSKKQFYDSFKLIIIPQVSDNGHKFELFEEEHQAEVVCYKSTFIGIFKEAHQFMRQYLTDLDFQTYLNTNTNYLTFYQVTIGLILTTAENKTNFNLHNDIFFVIWNNLKSKVEKIDFLLKETFIITRLLTCSSNKVNKSSSLYIWYRKLFILWQGFLKEDHDGNIDKLLLTSRLFLASGKQHLANYYSWNTSRWIFDNLELKPLKQTFINDVKSFCFQSFSDCSSWDTLSYMICQYKIKNTHHIDDYERLRTILNEKLLVKRDVVWIQTDLPVLVHDIINHISKCKIKTWPPFLCLLRILSIYSLELADLISRIKIEWIGEVEKFESVHGKITLYNKFTPIIPCADSNNYNDYLVTESLLHLGHKLVFLNKLSEKA
ncbi:protein Ecm9p [Monosporozyma unispora]|nr:hypothetical protein C6P44_000611 [Kazachstania unispora]